MRIRSTVAGRGVRYAGVGNGRFRAELKEGLGPKRVKGDHTKMTWGGWWVHLILTGASEGSAVTNPAGLQEPAREERHRGGFIKSELMPQP